MIAAASSLSSSILINSSTYQFELIAESSFIVFYTHQLVNSSIRVDSRIVFLILFYTHQLIDLSIRVDSRGIFSSCSILINSLTRQFGLIAESSFSSCSKIPPKGSLYGLSIVLVVCIAACLSFVCLSAFCQPCPFDVTRYAFKDKIGKMLHNITRTE